MNDPSPGLCRREGWNKPGGQSAAPSRPTVFRKPHQIVVASKTQPDSYRKLDPAKARTPPPPWGTASIEEVGRCVFNGATAEKVVEEE